MVTQEGKKIGKGWRRLTWIVDADRRLHEAPTKRKDLFFSQL